MLCVELQYNGGSDSDAMARICSAQLHLLVRVLLVSSRAKIEEILRVEDLMLAKIQFFLHSSFSQLHVSAMCALALTITILFSRALFTRVSFQSMCD